MDDKTSLQQLKEGLEALLSREKGVGDKIIRLQLSWFIDSLDHILEKLNFKDRKEDKGIITNVDQIVTLVTKMGLDSSLIEAVKARFEKEERGGRYEIRLR